MRHDRYRHLPPARRARLRACLWAALGLTVLFLAACADRPRRNPLDPAATDPLDLADPLQAFATDGAVRLRWDFTSYEDIEAVRLYRDDGVATVVIERPPADTAYVDTGLVNGRRYSYRLGLRVRDQGEISIAGQSLATPGPERGWVADAGSGLVWQLTPDGRRGLFARGRFLGLAGLAVDTESGAAWVTDGRIGLHRIDRDGEVTRLPTPFSAAGDIALHGSWRRGWVVATDGEVGVFGFSLDAAPDAFGDSLALQPADAVFTGAVTLSPAHDGGVWAADLEARRVLWFAPDGTRRGEWRDLPGLLDVAASPRCCTAWALTDDGARLTRLVSGEEPWRLSSPVSGATGIGVDENGVVWVVGEGGVASVDADGVPLDRYVQVPPGAQILALAAGDVWVAGSQALWKISGAALTYRTELTGFTRIVAVAVDPGR